MREGEDQERARNQPSGLGPADLEAGRNAVGSGLADLLARVEAAEGPVRELDALIWLYLTPGATRKASVVKSAKGLWPDYTIDETRERGLLVVVPQLTASLDAALALVERSIRDSHVMVSSCGAPWSRWIAALKCDFDFASGLPQTQVTAGPLPTPALALLAALLKALIAQPLQRGVR